jgi:hypothetical protein
MGARAEYRAAPLLAVAMHPRQEWARRWRGVLIPPASAASHYSPHGLPRLTPLTSAHSLSAPRWAITFTVRPIHCHRGDILQTLQSLNQRERSDSMSYRECSQSLSVSRLPFSYEASKTAYYGDSNSHLVQDADRTFYIARHFKLCESIKSVFFFFHIQVYYPLHYDTTIS